MNNLKYLKNNYIPSGQLKGFPLEIIDKMIEKQVEQGNEANVTVFERNIRAIDRINGFYWGLTLENYDFWCKVINYKRFDTFFEKYPKQHLTKFNTL